MISETTKMRLQSLVRNWFYAEVFSTNLIVPISDFSGMFLQASGTLKKLTIPIFRNHNSFSSIKDLKENRSALILQRTDNVYNINQALKIWKDVHAYNIHSFYTKGARWLFGRGILMDEDRTVLMIATVDVCQRSYRYNGQSKPYLYWDNPVIRVNPKVLTDRKYEVWKNLLINGIMPQCKSVSHMYCSFSSSPSIKEEHQVTFSIEQNLNRFIHKVPKPGGVPIEETLTPKFLLSKLPLIDKAMV